ncbi:MAG TPA: hypothetical protein VGP96_06680 [Candidatus Dormibacteraeota bacterium]|nr:hypothetical protein [Candidatus Dormibacteraeota bacterium]
MLPRWFRLVIIADLALLATVAVLGARLALDGAHEAGRVITPWVRPGAGATAHPPGAELRMPTPPVPGPAPAGPVLSPALLHRLDSDAASSANAQRGLLGMIEEVIRAHIVAILEHAGRGGRGG